MSQAILEAQGISAGYAGVPAVENVDLEVRAGEIVALLGANGAGKTTTLGALAGALPTLAGQIRWEGRVTHAPLHARARRGLGFVHEGRSVFSKLTVADNFRVGNAAPEDAYELFPELKRLEGRRSGLLSGGEQQMVALARALIEQPKVLLADELSLGLAPRIVQRLLEILRSAARGGLGVLIVEQHAHLALKACDRAYVMQRGSVVMTGSGPELLARFDKIEKSYLAG
jgi:branched-chain amino acid transport system ATP-binding protein